MNLIFNEYDFYVYRAWTSACHAANVDYRLVVLFFATFYHAHNLIVMLLP